MKKINKKVIALLVALSFGTTLLNPVHSFADDKVLEKPTLFIDDKGKVDLVSDNGTVKDKSNYVTEFITKYRVIIAGISGVGAVSMILFFILGFIRLGATSANPEARSSTITGLVVSGVAAAGLGAVSFVTGIFFNAL